MSRIRLAGGGIIGGGVTSISNSDSTLTISPTTGTVIGSLNVANANTWSGKQTFAGNIALPRLQVSGNVTLSTTHCFITVDMSAGNSTITIPETTEEANAGRFYIIKRIGAANTLTIATSGDDVFDDGTASLNVATNFACVFLISDGTNRWWQIKGLV